MQPEGQRLRFPFFLSSFSLLRLPHLPSFLLLHLWTFAKKSGVATHQLGEEFLGEGPCWAVLRKASSRCPINTLWLVRRPPAQISLAFYRIYISRGKTALGYGRIDETFTLLGSHLAQKVFRIKRRSTFLAPGFRFRLLPRDFYIKYSRYGVTNYIRSFPFIER